MLSRFLSYGLGGLVVAEGDTVVTGAGPMGGDNLVFAPDGRLDRTIGRAGEGPGELMRQSAILAYPDNRLLVLQQGRRSVMDLDGEVVTKPPPGRGHGPDIFDEWDAADPEGDALVGADGAIRLGAPQEASRPQASIASIREDDQGLLWASVRIFENFPMSSTYGIRFFRRSQDDMGVISFTVMRGPPGAMSGSWQATKGRSCSDLRVMKFIRIMKFDTTPPLRC